MSEQPRAAGAAVDELAALASRLAELETALQQAVAEIEGSPYQSEPWGWGIAYRIKGWRAALTGDGGRG